MIIVIYLLTHVHVIYICVILNIKYIDFFFLTKQNIKYIDDNMDLWRIKK